MNRTIFLSKYFELQSSLNFIKIVIIVFALLTLKYGFGKMEVSDLQWFLYPIQKGVSYWVGIPFEWTEYGYYNSFHKILINRSCAGTNFLVLCMGLLFYKSFAFLHWKSILSIVLIATGFTMLINTFRIYILLKVSAYFQFLPFDEKNLHLFIGGLIYLFALLSIYQLYPKK